MFSGDGLTLRGTAVNFTLGGGTEFVPLVTGTHRSRFIALPGSVINTTVAIQNGDRIVVEIGYRCGAAPATPAAAMRIGAPVGVSDLSSTVQDEHFNLNLRSWIEFGDTLTLYSGAAPTRRHRARWIANAAGLMVPAGGIFGGLVGFRRAASPILRAA